MPADTLQVIASDLAAVGKQAMHGRVQAAGLFWCCLLAPALPRLLELAKDVGFARYRAIQARCGLQQEAKSLAATVPFEF